jgi:branched-chain amino acid transport system substrate-binding protein
MGFRRAFLALAAVAGLAVTAQAQPGAAPLRVGIGVSLTGALAEAIRPAMLADKVWEEEVNARGGLLGRKVELTFRDNRSNPDDGVSIFQRFQQGGYDFVFEDSGAFLVQRQSTLAEQHQMLFLTPNGFARSLYERGYKFLFFTGPAVSEDLNIGLVRLLKSMPESQRPKTIGYVSIENIAFTSITKGLQEYLRPLNMTSLLDVTYPPNLNDATPIVDNLKQRAPDLINHAGLYNDTLLLARSMKQQGLKAKLIVISQVAGAQPHFLSTFGDAVEGMIYASPWEPQIKLANNQDFVAAYQKANGVPPTYNAAQAYARWQIFEQAVNATKSFEHKLLRDYIANGEFETVVGKIKYNEKGYSTPPDTIIVQVQRGQKVVVWPKEHATGSLVYPNN